MNTPGQLQIKLDLLAFAAHPDDVELSAAGTIMRHIDAGRKAGIIDLTRGELGSRGNADIRMKESAAAASYMRLAVRDNLGLKDGFFDTDDREALYAIIRKLRTHRPEIVLCNAISDRHPDHGRGSEMVSRACFLSGLAKVQTGQASWRPKAVYHYIQDRYIEPDFVIDIGGYMDRKIEAIRCFSSQFHDPDSEEPQTPISSPAFLHFLEARAREMGRQAGFEFGEGFTVERHIGVRDLFSLY